MFFFMVGFWITSTGEFLLEKIMPCAAFLLKCFCYQLIGNSQAYQSLGVKQMQIVLRISLTKAFLAIRWKHIFKLYSKHM